METKYDIIVGWFTDNWVIAAFVFVCVVLIAIPQVRDGIKVMQDILKKVNERLCKNDVYKIKYGEETIVLKRLLRSRQFDVVKIDAISHELGISSEYKWLKEYYPKCEHHSQVLRNIFTVQGAKAFDIIPITIGKRKKYIYFDISSFFDGPIGEYGNRDAYVSRKINELYNKNL